MVCAKDRMDIDDVNIFVNKVIGRMNQCSPELYSVIIKNHRKMVVKRFRSDFDFVLAERMKQAGLVMLNVE